MEIIKSRSERLGQLSPVLLTNHLADCANAVIFVLMA
jgi:hypothetical protein